MTFLWFLANSECILWGTSLRMASVCLGLSGFSLHAKISMGDAL